MLSGEKARELCHHAEAASGEDGKTIMVDGRGRCLVILDLGPSSLTWWKKILPMSKTTWGKCLGGGKDQGAAMFIRVRGVFKEVQGIRKVRRFGGVGR